MGKLYHRYVRYVDSLVKTDRKLLRLVRSHPVLYDKRHPHFKKRKEKRNIWEFIAKTLNYTNGAKARKRWLYLIDKYRSRKWTLHAPIIESMDQLFRKKQTATFTIDQLEDDVMFHLFAEGDLDDKNCILM